MLLAFALARWLAARPDPQLKQPGVPGAAVAVALALSLGCMLLWALNPYAGLLAVPAAHVDAHAVLTRPLPPRLRWMLMVALGLVLPLLAVLYYSFALAGSPGGGVVPGDARDGARRGLRHRAGGLPPAGRGLRRGRVGWRTPEEQETPPDEPGPSVYGPGAYARPGSLGGTSSALER